MPIFTVFINMGIMKKYNKINGNLFFLCFDVLKFTMKMTLLLGGFDSAQPPMYNGIVIPAEAGIYKL